MIQNLEPHKGFRFSFFKFSRGGNFQERFEFVTRVIVAREGMAPFAGTFIERNCFTMKEGQEELWVVYPGGNYEPIGKARAFQRDEETGAISFDIQINNDFPIAEEHFALYANNLIESRIGDIRHVHEAIIQHVAYIPYAGYPASRQASQLLQRS